MSYISEEIINHILNFCIGKTIYSFSRINRSSCNIVRKRKVKIHKTVNRMKRQLKNGTFNVRELRYLMTRNDFDISFQSNAIFRYASQYGNIEVVRLLINNPKINPTARGNYAILKATKGGHLEVLKELIKCKLPINVCQNVVNVASQYGHIEILSMLLNDSRFTKGNNCWKALITAVTNNNLTITQMLLDKIKNNPFEASENPLQIAVENGFIEIVRFLMKDPRSTSAITNELLTSAIITKKFTVLKELLNDSRFNLNDRLIALVQAIKDDNIEIVKMLLQDPHMNLITNYNYALTIAIDYRRNDILKFLLADSRIDPSFNNNEVIHFAAARGYNDIIKLLLHDQRVNPVQVNNCAVCAAIEHKHYLTVMILLNDSRTVIITHLCRAITINDMRLFKMMLKHPRVNPGANNNCAIRLAVYYNRNEMVEILLNDSRVDPSDCDNKALHIALKNGNVYLIEILLRDKRVRSKLKKHKDINTKKI